MRSFTLSLVLALASGCNDYSILDLNTGESDTDVAVLVPMDTDVTSDTADTAEVVDTDTAVAETDVPTDTGTEDTDTAVVETDTGEVEADNGVLPPTPLCGGLTPVPEDPAHVTRGTENVVFKSFYLSHHSYPDVHSLTAVQVRIIGDNDGVGLDNDLIVSDLVTSCQLVRADNGQAVSTAQPVVGGYAFFMGALYSYDHNAQARLIVKCNLANVATQGSADYFTMNVTQTLVEDQNGNTVTTDYLLESSESITVENSGVVEICPVGPTNSTMVAGDWNTVLKTDILVTPEHGLALDFPFKFRGDLSIVEYVHFSYLSSNGTEYTTGGILDMGGRIVFHGIHAYVGSTPGHLTITVKLYADAPEGAALQSVLEQSGLKVTGETTGITLPVTPTTDIVGPVLTVQSYY